MDKVGQPLWYRFGLKHVIDETMHIRHPRVPSISFYSFCLMCGWLSLFNFSTFSITSLDLVVKFLRSVVTLTGSSVTFMQQTYKFSWSQQVLRRGSACNQFQLNGVGISRLCFPFVLVALCYTVSHWEKQHTLPRVGLILWSNDPFSDEEDTMSESKTFYAELSVNTY